MFPVWTVLLAALLALAPAWCGEVGVLRLAQRAEPKTLNPVTAMDAASREIVRRLHADLVSINRLTQQTENALAESAVHSKDGTEFSVRLRRGLRFSDGQPCTADDVVFSFALYLDPAIASPQRDLLIVQGHPIEVRKTGELSLVFRTAAPYAVTERLFDSIAILPKHKLEGAWKAGKIREAWSVTSAPGDIVGMGPFRLKAYRPGEQIELERNPFYYRKPLPRLDGLSFRLLPDEDTQLARFVSGDLDILTRVNPKAAAYVESRGLSVSDAGPGLEYNFVCFNVAQSGWFRNETFVKALSLAVDREAMVKLIFRGRAVPIWGNVTPGNRAWYHPGLPRPRHDVSSALRLLESAGFRRLANGDLHDATGRRVALTLLVSASSAERQQMVEILREDWKQLGIQVTPVVLEFRSFVERVTASRDFDACLLGLGGGDADPNAELNVWLSSGAMHLWNPAQKNPATVWERELDNLMRSQMTEMRPAERRKLYWRAQEIIAAHAPMVFLVSPHVVVAQSGKVGNFRPAVLDHQTLWNADELYLLPKKP